MLNRFQWLLLNGGRIYLVKIESFVHMCEVSKLNSDRQASEVVHFALVSCINYVERLGLQKT